MNDRRVGPPGRASHGAVAAPATMATQARYQPPMASYAPRPVGPWQALRTADGKHVYYHNAATNETTWTRPPNYVDPGPPGGLFPAPGSMAAAPSAASAPSSVTQIPVPGTTWYEVTQPGKPSYFRGPSGGRSRRLGAAAGGSRGEDDSADPFRDRRRATTRRDRDDTQTRARRGCRG